MRQFKAYTIVVRFVHYTPEFLIYLAEIVTADGQKDLTSDKVTQSGLFLSEKQLIQVYSGNSVVFPLLDGVRRRVVTSRTARFRSYYYVRVRDDNTLNLAYSTCVWPTWKRPCRRNPRTSNL